MVPGPHLLVFALQLVHLLIQVASNGFHRRDALLGVCGCQQLALHGLELCGHVAALRSEEAALSLVSGLHQKVANSGLLSKLTVLSDFGVTGAAAHQPSPKSCSSTLLTCWLPNLWSRSRVTRSSTKALRVCSCCAASPACACWPFSSSSCPCFTDFTSATMCSGSWDRGPAVQEVVLQHGAAVKHCHSMLSARRLTCVTVSYGCCPQEAGLMHLSSSACHLESGQPPPWCSVHSASCCA